MIRDRLKKVGDTSRGPENEPPKKIIRGKSPHHGMNIWMVNPAYTKFKADQKRRADMNKRPLKISDKGLTPARKLSKGEGKIKKGTTIGGEGPSGLGTKKQKEEYRKMMARRRLAKMGKRGAKFAQRKAGGTVKKYKHGGKVGKCPRDGIAERGHTKAKKG
jgi:hypothetical protein